MDETDPCARFMITFQEKITDFLYRHRFDCPRGMIAIEEDGTVKITLGIKNRSIIRIISVEEMDYALYPEVIASLVVDDMEKGLTDDL